LAADDLLWMIWMSQLSSAQQQLLSVRAKLPLVRRNLLVLFWTRMRKLRAPPATATQETLSFLKED